MDSNQNGRLEKEEVYDFCVNMHERTRPGQQFNEDDFEDHFENLDKNEDGTVSR